MVVALEPTSLCFFRILHLILFNCLLFSGNFPYWRPLEEKEFGWSWSCYTMHCSYKNQWSVPYQCALENQCKGKIWNWEFFTIIISDSWLIITPLSYLVFLCSWVAWIPFWLRSFPQHYLRFQRYQLSLLGWMSPMAHLDEQMFPPLQR